jgi:hypothetical protein
MRCYSCNVILSTSESVRRFKQSGEFTELCTKCLNTIDDVETEDGAYEEENDNNFES